MSEAEATYTPPPITGYRNLTQSEVDLMNAIKRHGVQLHQLVETLRAQGDTLDQRWVSIGATDLQTGLMALVRAVAKPTTF